MHDKYEGRISFPYITKNGVVNLRFRRVGDGKGQKVLSSVGEVPRLYNVTALQGAERIFVCEGETDTIAASMAGLSAVGVPGATTWDSKVWPRIFRDMEVVVLPDNDDAGEGQKLADNIFRSLGGCDMVTMPEGYDVSRFVQEFGTEALREKVGYG